MPNIDFLTEATAQEILGNLELMNAYMEIYLKKWQIDSWDAAFTLGRSGRADKIFNIGDQLIGKYTVNGTEYECPWDVVGFRDVIAQVNGIDVPYKNVPIIQMHYSTHENIAFDAAEMVEATETTAQEGVYYIGNTDTTWTELHLTTGATIPYSDYAHVYKTPYNSPNAVRYGNSSWPLSYARQYLNNSGDGWAQPTHEYDVLPNNAATQNGFLTYLEADMVANLKPIKIATKAANYRGGALEVSYDKMFPLSVSEMNMSSSAASADDGDPLAYYKELLESEQKVPTGTYAALIKYAINAKTSAQYVRLRSAGLGSYYVWIVLASGSVYYGTPGSSYRLAPACALC